MKTVKHPLFLFLILAVILSSCQNDQPSDDSPFVVKIRLPDEPDRINPMQSTNSVSTQVEGHIFLPLMEYDPSDLQLKPILVEGPPKSSEFGDKGSRFKYRIADNAVWADGTPVTAEDYLFTLKAALNPHTNANAWRGFLSQIDSVALDPEDNKKFEVFLDESYLLALPITCNFNIYPKHFYDPKGLLDDISLGEIRRDTTIEQAQQFAKDFNDVSYSRDKVLGSGPYKLSSWTAGQSLILEKIGDWWGEDIYPANPDKLVYAIVPDEATAINMIKTGEIDILSAISPNDFAEMRDDTSLQGLSFETPSILQYYYLSLNNDDIILQDVNVRKALAHLLDLEELASVLMADLAKPIAGPIHPSKTYFDPSIKPVAYDVERSKELLEAAGWKDTNGDGTVDKVLEGQRQELDLNILVTQRELGKNLALIFKENAKQAGININVVSQEFGEILRKVGARDFDIAAMATRQSIGIDDMYQGWHTSSIGPDGRNVSGFGDERSDALIEKLRVTEDENKRKELFFEIQSLIYERQPQIFLFAPTQTVIHNSELDMVFSPRRPGYFENTARKK